MEFYFDLRVRKLTVLEHDFVKNYKHTSRTRVRASSGPLINFIKWALKYLFRSDLI